MQNFFPYIYGRNPIIEALKNPENIEKIYIEYGSRGDVINKIITNAKNCKVPCTIIDKSKFSKLIKEIPANNINHQGIIAQLKLYDNLNLQDLLKKVNRLNELPILLIIDSINDPHNIGAIARTAECAGVSGLIITQRKSSPISPTVIKASSGAIAHLPIAKVGNLTNALKEIKEHGFWVYGTSDKAEKSYTNKIYDRPVALIIGNEGKGIGTSILKKCDYIIRIPIFGKTESLNASVSAGIILYEILRQRNMF